MTFDTSMQAIQTSLHAFASGDLAANARSLFAALGYASERQQPLEEKTFAGFSAYLHDEAKFSEKNALVAEWRYVDLLFQLTGDELNQQAGLFIRTGIDDRITSYLFFALELTKTDYTRTALSQITRELNKVFSIPVLVLFKYGEHLTLAVIDRQPHKRDESKDVLRKVTLIKDIRFAAPHRAHLEILHDLSLPQLNSKFTISNFLDLHQAWQKVLDTKELNKRFFRELANWYFWAVDNVTFPADEEKDEAVRNATSVIRLITRLMFVWFLKEKGLVSDKLFDERHIKTLLHGKDESSYYKAILQNLFFATLNSNMGERKFRTEKEFHGAKSDNLVHNVFRYKSEFHQPDQTIAELFEPIPFLNGGLFECLDKDNNHRVDGFSDSRKNVLRVPDELFFSEERKMDLSEKYGDKKKAKETVRGLIHLLNSYKFTIAENTPIEEEIALDPELLGKVFENLLANYNPETRTTARKQTGSFYTPREIVNYMVDESLIAYLKTKLQTETVGFESFTEAQTSLFGNDMRRQQVFELPIHANRWHGQDEALESALRDLLGYDRTAHDFTETETEILIKAIDTCQILDPACGSGAFPMGILLKLVHLLEKLDPDNAKWREWQKRKAIEETKAAYDIGDKHEREQRLQEISEIFDFNSSDYGRKLFLIENCIYGVDIQPVAIQIAKLRFFISLIVDQDFNDDPASNRGIRPLPNLETKFVAANTLIGLEMSGLKPNGVDDLEKQLKEVRAKHFGARTRKTKEKYRLEDKRIRNEIADLLKQAGFPETSANQISGWNPYDQNAKADWFDAEWMFGVEQGFDIVIGNPPYVRQEEIKEFKPLFSKQYECFTGTADLFVYFYECAWRSLREKGVFTFITSNKYFRSGYGAKLRKFLSEKAAIQHLIDFGDAPIFTAIAYPSILLAAKQKPNTNQVRALTWNSPEPPAGDFSALFQSQSFWMPQKELTSEAWRLESGVTLRLLEKLRSKGKPLGEYVNGRFYYGIKTGLNEAFVVDRATRDRLIAEDASSAEVLKPFLRGRDVKRWRVEFAEQYLIKIESSANKTHLWSGKNEEAAEKIFAKTYPAIHAHFQEFRKRLIDREDQGKYFWELRACVYWNTFEEAKIIYPDIYEHQSFAWDLGGFYSVNTTYFIPTKEQWLTALLNSTLVEWFYASISNRIRGGYLRAFSDYMKQIPIPNATASQQSAITSLVDKILVAKKAEANAETKHWEAEIDALVYQLYGLTNEEIAIVAGASAAALSPAADTE
jgi:adenine-specific DNA-methyltransferase